MIIKVTADNFQEEVLESEQPVLVDFWATWCGNCKMVRPFIEQISEEQDKYKVCMIDVDNDVSISKTYRVMSLPTLIVFDNGKEKRRVSGPLPKTRILQLIS